MSESGQGARSPARSSPLVRIRGTQARAPGLRGVRPSAAATAGREAKSAGTGQHRSERRNAPRSTRSSERALITFRQREQSVALLNVSRTGAMVADEFLPKIGERLRIAFDGCNPTRCMVRWIRNGRIGLEFVKETTLLVPADWERDLNAQQGDGTRPTAPDPEPEPAAQAAPAPAAVKPETPPGKAPRAPRERVLWPCELFWDGGSSEAGLRNISAEGAMVAGFRNLKAGTDVVLALKSAGSIAGTVRWCRAGQVGIHFERRFDVTKLIDPRKLRRPPESSRPGIVKPLYLETELDPDSPWAARWEKLDPQDLPAKSRSTGC